MKPHKYQQNQLRANDERMMFVRHVSLKNNRQRQTFQQIKFSELSFATSQ